MPLSIANLDRAPHRLMFFVGTLNLLLAMAWWALWLASSRWALFPMPQPDPYAGRLHAFLMQYQVLPSFFFGFLLTVFPRWIGQPEIARGYARPVAIGLFAGQLLTLTGALGWHLGAVIGALLTLGGWLVALVPLGRLARIDAGRTWHMVGCFGALCVGAIGIALWTLYLLTGNEPLGAFSLKLGTFGLLAPVYFTVAHRMFPFFAASALPGYKAWRPQWVLAAGWALMALHLALPERWLWLADLPLCVLTLLITLRWFPRRRMPPLLLVLFAGLLWLPIAFALYTAQDLALALHGETILGRAPAHALFVGFFGSILIAMVTRVTQGHSGRPLVFPPVAAYAFIAVQLVCLIRIGAELSADWLAWQSLAAFGWIVAFLPWVIWAARIYTAPRADGRPG